MDRTVVLELHPTAEQQAVLRETLSQYTACFNAVCAEGFPAQISNGVELHKRTYYPLRTQYPHLPAQLVCSARVKATEAVKSALTWKQKREQAYARIVTKAQQRGRLIPAFRPVRTPHSAACPIRYDQRSYRVRIAELRASLATVEGRVELPVTAPHHAACYLGGEPSSADLCYRKGRWFLHVVMCLPTPEAPDNGKVVGVDLGLAHPAVTSEHRFLGERRWREQEQRIFRLRRVLLAKGTHSAKRHLKRLSGKQFQQRRDHDHVLSKRLVQSATLGTTIAIENLRDIAERTEHRSRASRRRHHAWSFFQFQRFLAYKAEERGLRVVTVDPRYTSQTCSRCGFQHRSNRRSQSLFHCHACGFQCNADLNAARNVRDKHLARLGRPVPGWPMSDGLSSQSSDGLKASPTA
jgi:IS605 OrfB family transposase